MIVVLCLDNGDWHIGFEVQDVVRLLRFASLDSLPAHDHPATSEEGFLADLCHQIPFCTVDSCDRGRNELAADVCLSELFLVHREVSEDCNSPNMNDGRGDQFNVDCRALVVLRFVSRLVFARCLLQKGTCEVTKLWLGAEYAEYESAQIDYAEMNDLMKRFLSRDASMRRTQFLQILEKQVSVFGSPQEFFYDDVSRVRATGTHSEACIYEQNVRNSVEHHVRQFELLKPTLILVGGGLAFENFRRIVQPHLSAKSLAIVRIRNASRQAHRGPIDSWMDKYRETKLEIPEEQGIRFYHLACRSHRDPFQLRILT